MSLYEFFKNKKILVTGGTGSIGSEIVSHLLRFEPKVIRILSNSENELWETKFRFQESLDKLRFLLGDIRDFERMKRATKGVNYVFNAAAIKHVPISEYNPLEAINVNIHGLENIIEASLINNVDKLIHISTDKAVNPTTVMGATKMLGERLCISRALAIGEHKTKISVIRFGNVLGSRGSIIPLIKKQLKKSNTVTLTDPNMNRFFLSISQAIESILNATVLANGGEIFVLKMPSINIKDLIEIIIENYAPKIGKNPGSIEIKNIGPRDREKLDEQLLSSEEFLFCYETESLYIIYPPVYFNYDELKSNIIGKKAEIIESFKYSTENNKPLNREKVLKLLIDFELL